MDPTALYDEDFYQWSLHQAQVLRRLAASGLPLPNDLDLEHVAEEIEDLGNEQRFVVESNLEQALMHLIKIVALPGNEAVRHWAKEANAFLANATDRYRPTMRQAIDFAKLWSKAHRRAAKDLQIDGHVPPPLPDSAPFALDALVSEEADAQDLAAQLAAAVAALRSPPRA
jgi:hypothetical protein